MIDFRYHLVSLISVFLALAVGIILGAGPLQGALGDQLTDQVETLRTERNDLRYSLEASQKDAARRLTFIEAAGPSLVQGSLEGLRVAIVELDVAAGDSRQAVVDGIEAAGGTVVGAATLQPAWTDADHAGFRETIAGGMRPRVSDAVEGLADDASSDDVIGAALGIALSGQVTTAERSEDATALQQQLVQEGLIAVDGEQAEPADIVVLLAGPTAEEPADDEEEPSPAPAATAVDSFVALARAVQSTVPTVVVGPTTVGGDVVSGVRGDRATADAVSTVSGVDTTVGRIVVPLALAAQFVGEVGQYGFEDDASVLPPDVRGQWTIEDDSVDPDAVEGENGEGVDGDGTADPDAPQDDAADPAGEQ